MYTFQPKNMNFIETETETETVNSELWLLYPRVFLGKTENEWGCKKIL